MRLKFSVARIIAVNAQHAKLEIPRNQWLQNLTSLTSLLELRIRVAVKRGCAYSIVFHVNQKIVDESANIEFSSR